MAKDRLGRGKGSRNKSYFYRDGRGWLTKVDTRFVPLTNEAGERLDQETGRVRCAGFEGRCFAMLAL